MKEHALKTMEQGSYPEDIDALIEKLSEEFTFKQMRETVSFLNTIRNRTM